MDLLSKELRALVAEAVESSVERVIKRHAAHLRPDERDRPSKEWLTNAEATKYLQLSKPTLARWRADGTLAFSKLGQSVYYRLADVEALLESSRTSRTSGAAR